MACPTALLLCVLVGREAAAGPLPEAPGKEVVEKICAACHEIGTVIGSRHTKIGWQQNVDDMIARGADGPDEEMAAIVEYLAAFFGKINVNTATARDLEQTLGLSGKEAQAVAGYRERNGKIKDFEELKQVPGVSAEKLQAKRGLIAFNL